MRKILSMLCLFMIPFSSPLPVGAESYTVVQGDTLYKIARQYHTTTEQLLAVNQLSSDHLAIGQVLFVPGIVQETVQGDPFVGTASPSTGADQGTGLPQEQTHPRYVTVPTLNVRAYPSLESPIIGKVTYGTKLDMVQTGTQWLTIQYNGGIAYVSADYVADKLPQVVTASAGKDFTPDFTPVVSADAEKLMELIQPLLGTPYRFGGTTTDGFDCSGFTSYVMEKLGVRLPRTSEEQYASGQEVAYEDAMPGDLLFYDSLHKGTVSHVALYLGNGSIVHANGDTVRFEKVENMNKLYPFYGVKRYLAVK